MRLNPVLEGLATYPFVRLTEAAAQAACERGATSSTSGSASRARRRRPSSAARWPTRSRPSRCRPTRWPEGLPELREAIAAWCERRFGASARSGDRGRADARLQGGDLPPRPGRGRARRSRGRHDARATRCPRAAPLFAGAEVLELPLDPARGWLPDLDAVDWSGVALLWLNFPEQPDRGDAPAGAAGARGRARAPRTASSLACDEAYSELWFAGEPPLSGLQLERPHAASSCSTRCPSARRCPATARASWPATRRSSPRSSATGPTSASRRRPSSSARRSPPGATRTTCARPARATRAKRDVLLPALRGRRAGRRRAATRPSSCGWRSSGDAEAFALALLRERGIVVAPGPFFGPGGEGHVRVALVPTLEACREAARA